MKQKTNYSIESQSIVIRKGEVKYIIPFSYEVDYVEPEENYVSASFVVPELITIEAYGETYDLMPIDLIENFVDLESIKDEVHYKLNDDVLMEYGR